MLSDNLFPPYRVCCIAGIKCIYPELSCFAAACQVGLVKIPSVLKGLPGTSAAKTVQQRGGTVNCAFSTASHDSFT